MSELFDALISLDGSLAASQRPTAILTSVLDHLPTLLPCRLRALATIDETTLMPAIIATVPAEAGDQLSQLLESAVARGLFALALRRGQSVIDELPDREVLVLQACATPNHLAGLVIGVCQAEAAAADRLAALALAAARAGAAHENSVLNERILAHTQNLEHAVHERTRDLAAARDRAEAASRTKSSFLATVSHELRTPLNGIIGMTELLHSDETIAARRDRLVVVRSCAEDLLRQIDGILDLSRIEAGRLDLAPAEGDPGAVVMSVLRTLAPGAEAKGLELAWLPARNFPTRAVIDSGRLRQVLMNLTGNALKFTASGSVAVRGEALSSEDGWRLTFQVVDTGPGIPAEAQARLFTPFEQGDASINRRFGGSGLGLSISRRLCEAMGGGITLISAIGKGSTFCASINAGVAAPGTQSLVSGTAAVAVPGLLGKAVGLGLARCGLDVVRVGANDLLVLDGDQEDAGALLAALPEEHAILVLAPLSRAPLAMAALAGRNYRLVPKPPDPESLAAAVRELRSGKPHTSRHERRPASGEATKARMAGARVMYVDDQHVNRLVVAGQLKRLGIDVELATGGAEAIELALADQWDVILMDCQMPEIDGFMAAARIRERGCRTPLIAVTAHAMAGDREECLLRGFDDYLAKPVRPDELSAALGRWVGRSLDPAAAPPAAPKPVAPAAPSRLGALRAEVGDEVLREVVQAMLLEGPRLVGEAVASVAAGDLAVTGRRAHALKGDAGNLGIDDLAELARELELAARSGETAKAQAAAARLNGVWSRAEAILRQELERPIG